MTSGAHTDRALRVLVLEHDLADAELCLLTLQRAGYTVTSDLATNAKVFLERLQSVLEEATARLVRESAIRHQGSGIASS